MANASLRGALVKKRGRRGPSPRTKAGKSTSSSKSTINLQESHCPASRGVKRSRRYEGKVMVMLTSRNASMANGNHG